MKEFYPWSDYNPNTNEYRLMDLNEWYKHYSENPGKIKCMMIREMFRRIVNEFIRLTNNGDGLELCEMDLDNINYSHYCHICGWPDLQDGGIFEQCIEEAGEIAIRNYFGYTPRWSTRNK